jgi:omega-hydroxy-beta-dihydromenaquinone-9 sulfotransferase
MSETLSAEQQSRQTRADDGRLSLARWLFSPLAGITFSQWAWLMGKYGLTMPPRYWPRNLFTLSMSIMNSAIKRWEMLRFGKKMARIDVPAPVFVMGHHRSGTTHLWNLLSQDKRFCYPSVLQSVFPQTFLTFERLAHGAAERFAPRKRPQDNVTFTPDSPLEEEYAICNTNFLTILMSRVLPNSRDDFKAYLSMRNAGEKARADWKTALDNFARKLLVRHGRDRKLLFKAPNHTAKIALIRELYPEARFIHIHRHPHDVYRSTVKLEHDTIPLCTYQRPDWDTLDDFILWRYREMYDAYFEDAAAVSDGHLAEIGFAELNDDPVGVLERVYQQLDLPDFETARPAIEAYVARISGYRKNSYKPLPEETRTRLAEAWKPAFERWGYEP